MTAFSRPSRRALPVGKGRGPLLMARQGLSRLRAGRRLHGLRINDHVDLHLRGSVHFRPAKAVNKLAGLGLQAIREAAIGHAKGDVQLLSPQHELHIERSALWRRDLHMQMTGGDGRRRQAAGKLENAIAQTAGFKKRPAAFRHGAGKGAKEVLSPQPASG